MKAGWEIKPLEDCIEKVSYTNKIERKNFLLSGKHPVISQEKDFVNGFWDDDNDVFLLKKPVVVFGDHTKVIKYINFNFVIGADGIKILQPKNNIEAKYLYYFLCSIELEDLGYARHYRLLKEIPISFPKNSQEQRRIVAILDEAFAGIAAAKEKAEQNLKNAKEVFDTYSTDIFSSEKDGWKIKKLQDVVDSSCSLSYGIVQPGEEFQDGLPIVRPVDLTNKFTTLSGLKYINPTLAESYKRTTLSGNEILMCVRGNTGVISISSQELKGANVTRGIVPIRFDSMKVNKLFGFYALGSNYVQKQIKAKTYGAALMQINISDLRNININFPEEKEQRQIVSQLDSLSEETSRLESIYQQKLSNLEELKKSLLQQAFSGAL